ncbi:MAG: hypothetical protein FE834_09975 [Gammaproteobacteria bacterium]|nr:hypothetical protein [Gammaproteobacteria bacterium]
MDDFKKLVETHYKRNSSETISNGSVKHAKVLVEYLFRLAEEKGKNVSIVTGSLEKSFYETFTEAIEKILKNNTVSIISENAWDDSSFASAIKKSEKGFIKIFKPNEEIQSPPHFILVGNSAYRLETDDKLKIATASFNRPAIGEFLELIFKEL